MLLTASTIKDSPTNVQFFVAANLASGVDHMFVFLDAPEDPEQTEVAAALADHPHVTCIPTGRQHLVGATTAPRASTSGSGSTPTGLARLLEPFAWAEWLFHIDGDEVACVDRDALAAVPAGRRRGLAAAVGGGQPVDAAGRPTRFKRLLDDADLNLLHVLGAIDEPTNQAYFHGHVMGKSGVRPGSGLGADPARRGRPPDGQRQPRHEDPRLRVLHYDAPSGEEFVRKWTALGPGRTGAATAPTGPRPRGRCGRWSRATCPRTLRAKYLRRIYDLTTRDDVETARRAAACSSRHDPLRGGATPRPLPDGRCRRSSPPGSPSWRPPEAPVLRRRTPAPADADRQRRLSAGAAEAPADRR